MINIFYFLFISVIDSILPLCFHYILFYKNGTKKSVPSLQILKL